jgi:enoyl-CoA hydratase
MGVSTMTNPSPQLIVEDDAHIRVLRLNRPERRNALSLSLTRDLVATLLSTAADRGVWAVVVTGTGPDAFCAGMDLKEAYGRDAGSSTDPNAVGAVPNVGPFETLRSLPMPTIAAINGTAVAGGLELTLACDIRVCSSSARLGVPEVARGLVGNFAATILPRLIPASIAHEILFTAQLIDAETALRVGLVSQMVEPDEVLTAALAVAAKITANAPIAVRRTKARARAGTMLPVENAYRLDLGPDPRESRDRREGIAAFVEKRQPNWENA